MYVCSKRPPLCDCPLLSVTVRYCPLPTGTRRRLPPTARATAAAARRSGRNGRSRARSDHQGHTRRALPTPCPFRRRKLLIWCAACSTGDHLLHAALGVRVRALLAGVPRLLDRLHQGHTHGPLPRYAPSFGARLTPCTACGAGLHREDHLDVRHAAARHHVAPRLPRRAHPRAEGVGRQGADQRRLLALLPHVLSQGDQPPGEGALTLTPTRSLSLSPSLSLTHMTRCAMDRSFSS